MERFKILLLTVAVLAQAMSQNSTTESPVQISKPKITVNPDHGVLYNTESVTLSCEISEGPPGLQYDWYKDSKDLGQHQRSITVNENGKYECKGKRRETRSEKSDVYTLTLKDPPKAQLTVNPEWTEYFVTEKINLRCKIEDGSSGWIFEWIKDSWTSEKDDVQTLNVKHSDSGEYSCRGKLSNRQVTTQQSNTFQLKVKEMPQSQVQSDWTEAFPGEKVTLKCKMQDALKNCNYMWFKGQTKIVSSGETNIKGNSLTLSVQSSHDGEYVCQAELHHRKVTTEKSAPHSLKVHGSKPTLHLQQDPSYSEIYTGEQVKLTCNIQEQTSQWEYQWKKDSTQENSHIYIIPSAELSHDGSYTCQVGRRGTTFSQSIKLTIREPPQPNLSVAPLWKPFYPTEKVTLKCSIGKDSNEWGFEWFRNEALLRRDKDTSEDTLSAKAKHSGEYTCRGKHKTRTPVTTGRAKALPLQIYNKTPRPSINKHQWFEPFYTNERVQLHCHMSGNSWEYQWYKNLSALNTNEELTLDSLSVTDTGDYHCKAKRGDFSVDSMTLRVQVQKLPELQIQSEWTEAFPGEQVSLHCVNEHVSNNWTYMWFRGSDKIVSGAESNMKGDSLTLSVQSSHNGEYVCQAELHHRKVTTEKSAPHSLKVYGSKPTLNLQQDPSYSEIYTGEQVKLTCNIQEQTSQWEYQWKKDSTQENSHIYIIPSAELSHDGSYTCQVGRRGTTFSQSIKLTIRARPPALLSLETELGDIMTGYMTLRCNVSDGRNWNYTWFMDGQQLNASSDVLRVTGNEENIRREFKCKGINTVRPLYSALSDGFIANNIIFKRKILLAISGCLVCCIVILIIGCIILKVTRKPEVKETAQEDLFFSMTDFKNQTASPMKEYMDNRPSELEDCEEKEELITGRASAAHEDAVIKDEDTPASETNGMTSFKGL
ncbi:titin-like isoform X1 [Puntigrus tetrazona]|uniref:titin-like isoform X1 n=1 Tax=Puntigrus tetrazona TaxID=1606681 RepID=UPI001C89FD33|nr:titin-like isoform X1 [Puntigrus tetrazona]